MSTIATAKKLVEILEDIDNLDKKIEKKFKNNDRELKFYIDLQSNTDKYFSTIIENLKTAL